MYTVNNSWICFRYNVSCSHHFRISRGIEAGERPPGSPAMQDIIARRRGPRRSSSEIACAKIAGRHLPVKVSFISCMIACTKTKTSWFCFKNAINENLSGLSFQCQSESSHSEDNFSCDGEEEEDFLSLSPSSSFSCPRPAHCGPQLDDTAPGGLQVDGDHFLSGNPAHWSVEEVCRFISSLQGKCSILILFAKALLFTCFPSL